MAVRALEMLVVLPWWFLLPLLLANLWLGTNLYVIVGEILIDEIVGQCRWFR